VQGVANTMWAYVTMRWAPVAGVMRGLEGRAAVLKEWAEALARRIRSRTEGEERERDRERERFIDNQR
jgi:hypothetical protein